MIVVIVQTDIQKPPSGLMRIFVAERDVQNDHS
jgi:hypothetical protein